MLIVLTFSNNIRVAHFLCFFLRLVFVQQEAALQIKIIVVELAGEHAPNTVWVSSMQVDATVTRWSWWYYVAVDTPRPAVPWWTNVRQNQGQPDTNKGVFEKYLGKNTLLGCESVLIAPEATASFRIVLDPRVFFCFFFSMCGIVLIVRVLKPRSLPHFGAWEQVTGHVLLKGIDIYKSFKKSTDLRPTG